MKRILRVFPRRTAMTPDDDMVFIGEPGLFRPQADEVHVSVTFMWDIDKAYHLQDAWGKYYNKVRIGGPAFGTYSRGFIPGKYVKHGVTFTTRGCPNKCPWCLVPEMEGRFREINIKPGHIIQDNNILAASRPHFLKVCNMLNHLGFPARFVGGLETERLRDWHVDALKSVRKINEVWLACDTRARLGNLKRAVEKLSWLPRRKLRCYALIGWGGFGMDDDEQRLETIWGIGCLPFAQLYQPLSGDRIIRDKPWRDLARRWSRPAIMFANHKDKP